MSNKNVKIGFRIFTNDLRENKIENIIVMCGTEQFLIKWAVDSLVKKYINPATKALDYVVFDEENTDLDKVVEACETMSMFSERRIVWIKNFKLLTNETYKGLTAESKKNFLNYIGSSNSKTILIMSNEEYDDKKKTWSEVMKFGDFYLFNGLNYRETAAFVRKRLRNTGLEISDREMHFLIDTTGYLNKDSDYRLYNFENDLLKLIAHCRGGAITQEDISVAIDGDMATYIFDMIENISSNRKDGAFQLVHNILYSGKEAVTVIGAIVSQFEFMLSVKQMKENGMNIQEMQRKLRCNEYRLRKVLPFTSKYSEKKIRTTLSGIYDVDKHIKTGLLSPQLALEMFVASI